MNTFAVIVQRIGQDSSKVFMKVRFLLTAPQRDRSSMVEQFAFNELVKGSSPFDPT